LGTSQLDYCINTADDFFMFPKKFVNFRPATYEILWRICKGWVPLGECTHVCVAFIGVPGLMSIKFSQAQNRL